MRLSRSTVSIAPDHLRAIIDSAEAAYPEECCGLLSGSEADGVVSVDDVHGSDNLAADRSRRFEVDPALRLRLQRTLRGSAHHVVGIYHSHPDGPAQPSPRDLDAAWEPDLVWLVVAVRNGQAIQVTAHVLAEEGGRTRFTEVPLTTTDGSPPPVREPLEGGGLEL